MERVREEAVEKEVSRYEAYQLPPLWKAGFPESFRFIYLEKGCCCELYKKKWFSFTIPSSTHHSDSPVSQTIRNKTPNSVSFHPKISRWNPIVTCFDPQTDRNADSDLWCAQSLCTTGGDCLSGGSMTVLYHHEAATAKYYQNGCLEGMCSEVYSTFIMKWLSLRKTNCSGRKCMLTSIRNSARSCMFGSQAGHLIYLAHNDWDSQSWSTGMGHIDFMSFVAMLRF